MPKRIMIAAVATTAILMAPALRAAEPVKLYPFEKATLTYQLSGDQQGTQTIYIRDYGRSTVQHIQATIGPPPQVQQDPQAPQGPQTIDVWTFTDPQWVHTYDAVSKEGFRTPNPQARSGIEAATSQELFEKVTTSFGGKRIGSDTFKGKPCTVWDLGPQSATTICVDDQLVMQYMRTSNMMQGKVELRTAQLGTVDESKFSRPPAQYRDMPMEPPSRE